MSRDWPEQLRNNVFQTGNSMTPIHRSQARPFDLFKSLSDVDLDHILASAAVRTIAKDEAVFRQGEAAEAFFVLIHGRLKVTRTTADGQQIIVRFVVPGELFGIAKAIGRRHYPGTAAAVLESGVLAWNSSLWDELAVRHPSFAAKALAVVGERFLDAQTRLEEISTEDAERRIAHAVLRLVHQAGRRVEQGILIDFPIRRQDIAEMSGTTLHTVSRCLSAWEQAGWVEGGRQRLLVRDAHRLFALAEGKTADPG